jgi:hypothetical protein
MKHSSLIFLTNTANTAELQPYMLTIKKDFALHMSMAQFWEIGRGTGFELGREGIPPGGESERERVDTEVSARSWGDELVLSVSVAGCRGLLKLRAVAQGRLLIVAQFVCGLLTGMFSSKSGHCDY